MCLNNSILQSKGKVGLCFIYSGKDDGEKGKKRTAWDNSWVNILGQINFKKKMRKEVKYLEINNVKTIYTDTLLITSLCFPSVLDLYVWRQRLKTVFFSAGVICRSECRKRGKACFPFFLLLPESPLKAVVSFPCSQIQPLLPL